MRDDLSGFSLMDLFRSEAEGQVATLSEGLINLEGNATAASAIEPLMRAAHSLKGAARIVGLDPAVRIAHALEDAFVAAQEGKYIILPTHVDVLLRAVDLLSQIAQLDEARVADWEQVNEATLATLVAASESQAHSQSASKVRVRFSRVCSQATCAESRPNFAKKVSFRYCDMRHQGREGER